MISVEEWVKKKREEKTNGMNMMVERWIRERERERERKRKVKMKNKTMMEHLGPLMQNLTNENEDY